MKMDITETVNSLDNRIASLEVEMKLHRQTLDKMIERLVTVEQDLSLRPIRAEIVDKGWGVEPADDKPEYNFDKFAQGAREFVEKNDTHRTVTLRIPKGMRIGEAIRQVWMEAANSGYLGSVSDTDLQKALDEVQPNE